MKKNFKKLGFVFIFCLIFSLFAFSASAEESAEWKYDTYGDGVVLTEYLGSAPDVYVPAYIEENGTKLPVLKLGDGLFQNNDLINSVTLAEGIREVGAKAFYDCDSLVCVLLAETVKTIGDEAFYGCNQFNSIILYDGVTSIGNDVFFACPKLKVWCNEDTVAYSYVTANSIPFEILSIMSQPELVVVDGLTFYIQYGSANLIDCDDSLTEVVVPATVNGYPVLGVYEAFRGNSTVTKVTLPDSVKIIASYSFYYCTNLQSINIPAGLTTISDYAFYHCQKLTEVTIPSGVKNIGSRAFYDCSNLTSLTICEGVEYIGSYAFAYCYDLTEVTIPGSVKTIGSDAFRDCSNLTSLTICDGVEYIGSSAFASCYDLTEVIIPGSVKNISSYAFASCSKLTEVTIPGSVKTIDSYAFRGCTSLSRVTLNEGLNYIYSEAFAGCTSLRMLIIPASVSSISSNSFPSSTILLVYPDSYALSYAEQYSLLYHVLRRTGNPEIHYGKEIVGTVKGTDGKPAAGVTVELYYYDGTLKDSVTTDANGEYKFTYAEVGRYVIIAKDGAGNIASTSVSITRKNVFDVFLKGDTNLVLKTSYSISGTVSHYPAELQLIDGNGTVIATASASNGSFSFDNIANGTYIIKAKAEGRHGSVEITLYRKDIAGVHIEMIADVVNVTGTALVLERDGSTSARAWVDVAIYGADGNIIAVAKTDGNGNYSFEGIAMGEYFITASFTDIRPDKNYGYDRAHKLSGQAHLSVTELRDYVVETIILKEEKQATATIEGKVTAQGEPQICDIVISDVNGNQLASYKTKNNGKFKFVNIPDGTYTVTATTQSNGMGQTVLTVKDGEVYGETHIFVKKSDKVLSREEQFRNDVPDCQSAEELEPYRARIAEEKMFYDGLSKKEQKELSKEYVERLNKYVQWLAECEIKTSEGVVLDQGGLVISGDEIANGDNVSFELTVEVTDSWEQNPDGTVTDQDHITNEILDTAGDRDIVQYYEITMSKTVNGETTSLTDVYKDTDSNGKFRITLPISEEFKGYASYSIIHVHAGQVTTLADLDDNPNTITIEVDKFSTFVLVADENAMSEEVEDDPIVDDQPSVENSGTENQQPEEKLNFFQKIWRAILDFFRRLFGIKKKD